MSETTDLGSYFWRGGQRIDLEKEEEFFTVLVENETQLEHVRALPGVQEVKMVQNWTFKVRVVEEQRDALMARCRSEEIDGVCHHAYRPKQASSTRYYLTDRVVVKFKPDVTQAMIESILREEGTRVLKEYPGSPQTYLLQVTRTAGRNPIKVANALALRDEVAYAEPNLENRFQSFYIPADTLFDRQWHLNSWDGPDLVADADISATGAWDITRGKRCIVVAVIDDGFDLSHPDLSSSDKTVHPKDYVEGDASPFPVAAAGDYHGTPCAGVAIAAENGEGVVGIAPGCAFMPIRFPLSADDDLLWEIFDYVGKRADVISCSWGPPPVYAPLSQLLIDKFHTLATSGGPRKKGCVIVFAAGNYNAPLKDLDNTCFRWRHPTHGLVETRGPIWNGSATHPDVIAVASSTSLNRKAAYSNWGREISVCAPSNNRHPLDRQIHVPGRGIWTTDNERYGEDFTGGSRFTGCFGGTSSAAPLVAGVAALVLSANPALTAGQVKQILQETADKIVDTEPDPVLGLQKGDYDADGHSEWFGYGKVNAARAVQRARELRQDSIAELGVGAAVNGALEETGAARFFRLVVGNGLSIRLEGAAKQDFDLYLKRGSAPTTQDYDAVGYSSSANEQVVISPVEPGDYYVMVRSCRGAGDFEVRVELQ